MDRMYLHRLIQKHGLPLAATKRRVTTLLPVFSQKAAEALRPPDRSPTQGATRALRSSIWG